MSFDISQLETQLIYELTIDSVNGDRHLELLFGNLLAHQTDLWVTTVYTGNGGQLYHSIKDLLNNGQPFNERKMIPLKNGGYIGFINHLKPKIVTVHLNKSEGTPIHRDEFQELIQATFSAMAALSYEGHSFQEISIPVIGKKGIREEDYEGSLTWLIHYAVNYLKYAHVTKRIKYFVHIKSDVPFWERAITQRFAKNVMDPPNMNQFYHNVKGKIITQIDTFPNLERARVRQILVEIQKELEKASNQDYTLLVDRADQLVDFLLKDLYKLGGLSTPHSISLSRLPHKDVMALQKEEPVPDWFFTYLLTIRALKNNGYFITRPSIEDTSDEEVLFLNLLHRVISFYRDFYKQFYL